ELGRSRPIGAVRSTALRSTTLPALKAFLQGEQFFRHTAWDSALTAYQRAVAIDSGFALAWRRMSNVLGWATTGADSVVGVYALRAAALNHGLAPHDSMLIAAESLRAGLFTASADTAWRAHQARLYATLEEATRRYPEDPEVWHELGEAHLHLPQIGRTSPAQVLEPFDRAIALDSAFGESYVHPVELAIDLGRPDRAREYIARYLAHVSDTYYKHASGYRIADQLLAQNGARSPELERLIDSASTNELFQLYLALGSWPDSGEAGVRVARALKVSRRSDVPLFNTRGFRDRQLSSALAVRGHLREAYAVGGDSLGPVGTVAVLGGVAPEHAEALFRRWLADPPLIERPNGIPLGFNAKLFAVLPWWGTRRDTASLAAFAARMKSLAARAPTDVRTWLDYGAASAEAYGALARADTNGALNRFLNLPDTVCPCPFDQIITAQLLGARGRAREAAAVFEGHFPHYWWSSAAGLWRLERGRALERVGEGDQALEDYTFVAAIWRHADSVLQPYVQEAKAGLARLSGER
ncbi:MAG: tetratricopeptide repeat protein, partial [Gemmatimonadales bacterium]